MGEATEGHYEAFERTAARRLSKRGQAERGGPRMPRAHEGPRKAVIVGGSLGGLFAGHLLLRAGWDVQVYERAAEELQARGAGIVTHPELMAALEKSRHRR